MGAARHVSTTVTSARSARVCKQSPFVRTTATEPSAQISIPSESVLVNSFCYLMHTRHMLPQRQDKFVERPSVILEEYGAHLAVPSCVHHNDKQEIHIEGASRHRNAAGHAAWCHRQNGTAKYTPLLLGWQRLCRPLCAPRRARDQEVDQRARYRARRRMILVRNDAVSSAGRKEGMRQRPHTKLKVGDLAPLRIDHSAWLATKTTTSFAPGASDRAEPSHPWRAKYQKNFGSSIR